VVIEQWRKHYNTVRPHSRLKYLTPEEFVARGAKACDRSLTPAQARGRAAAISHGLRSPPPCAEVEPASRSEGSKTGQPT
jgi:Integrase core domain